MPAPSTLPAIPRALLLLAATALAGLTGCAPAPVPAPPPPPAAPDLGYAPVPIGLPVNGHPMITHVALADLDADGLLDILVCDAESDRLGWIRQFPRGTFTEHPLGEPIPGPAHVSVTDFNGDGRPDLLVASMGVVMPNNDRLGAVIVLENLGEGRFRHRVLLDKVARVTDVRAADLNGDGRPDLVVGQFGFNQGEIRWMENLGDWNFRSHLLLDAPGTIHTPVADFDGDGRPDFAALVSQDSEEVRLYLNAGDGQLRASVLWQGPEPTWNSSGLEIGDLNRDGRPDLLYANGDGFDGAFMAPTPWHGLQWLENRSGGTFAYHRIGDMTGCYSPVLTDLNGDGHPDIVTSSAFSNANDSAAVSLMAWLNDGRQNFTPVPLARAPTHLITVAAGDLDGNGVPVLVTGGFFGFPPFNELSRVTLWRQKK